ncbi:MAG: endonuclease/exonuclease/phosphatase family protein [Chromatiales bacterium]|jgi:endonuclease/exonuclease/phosphatase family metal-dependent hydrolase
MTVTQSSQPCDGRTLRLLSYNIQAGANSSSYRDYFTKGWRHLLPNRGQLHNLNEISRLFHDADLVGLQEVDAGSFRSGFINQTRYLAGRASFPYWYTRANRNVGKLAQHSNGILSRYQPSHCFHQKLPGMPGRGVLVCEFAHGEETLAMIVAHLALGSRSRRMQFDFLQQLAERYPHVILMGDFNCEANSPEMHSLLQNSHLVESNIDQNTFPSWNPVRKIDHILVSDSLQVCSSQVVNYYLSDHLPVCLTICVPDTVELENWRLNLGNSHGENGNGLERKIS